MNGLKNIAVKGAHIIIPIIWGLILIFSLELKFVLAP